MSLWPLKEKHKTNLIWDSRNTDVEVRKQVRGKSWLILPYTFLKKDQTIFILPDSAENSRMWIFTVLLDLILGRLSVTSRRPISVDMGRDRAVLWLS